MIRPREPPGKGLDNRHQIRIGCQLIQGFIGKRHAGLLGASAWGGTLPTNSFSPASRSQATAASLRAGLIGWRRFEFAGVGFHRRASSTPILWAQEKLGTAGPDPVRPLYTKTQKCHYSTFARATKKHQAMIGAFQNAVNPSRTGDWSSVLAENNFSPAAIRLPPSSFHRNC